MSRVAEGIAAADTPLRLRQLLHAALAEFVTRSLGDDHPMLTLLADDARRLGTIVSSLPWAVQRDMVQRAWPPQQGPLAHLIDDLRLDLPQALLLTLLGEAEISHTVNLVLAELQAPSHSPRPAVHLCVALIQELFGADALSVAQLRDSPLLRERLVEPDGEGPLPLQQLKLHPSLWRALCGDAAGWDGCRMLANDPGELLPAALHAQLPRVAAVLAAGTARGVVLRGHPGSGQELLAQVLAAELGQRALLVPDKLWNTEPALRIACRYAGWLPVVQPEIGPGESWRAATESLAVPLVLLLGRDGAIDGEDFLELELTLPTEDERRRLWSRFLDHTDLAAETAAAALLSGPAIVRVAATARLQAQKAGGATVDRSHIARARRELSASSLRLLAQPIEREIDAEALVVPEQVQEALDAIVIRVRQRDTVWQGLGSTLTATRTPGVRALFVGESGTGKTLAASYVATALGAPLYRVDLAAVMNKYIGESEKNLAALLDHAAASDVALLFDEADALFGRRSDGKEVGERYANMLTNFLLSRIETHPGLVILTSNSRERIDAAFNRRLDAIVDFPLPRFPERLRLWQSHFGSRGPDAEICRQLASHCDLTGGQIRNVVLHAVSSMPANGPVSAAAVLAALRKEYDKLGRALPARLEKLGE